MTLSYKTSRYKTSLKTVLVSILLCPASLRPQMLPVGRLVISSEPPGATVTINGKPQRQPTNATFVVSSGDYKVSVAGPDGKTMCAVTTVTVSQGQTVTRNCTASGWK
jgi:PEGA domain